MNGGRSCTIIYACSASGISVIACMTGFSAMQAKTFKMAANIYDGYRERLCIKASKSGSEYRTIHPYRYVPNSIPDYPVLITMSQISQSRGTYEGHGVLVQ